MHILCAQNAFLGTTSKEMFSLKVFNILYSLLTLVKHSQAMFINFY